jgi:hypothetical protein
MMMWKVGTSRLLGLLVLLGYVSIPVRKALRWTYTEYRGLCEEVEIEFCPKVSVIVTVVLSTVGALVTDFASARWMGQDCVGWNESLNYNRRFEEGVNLADLWVLLLFEKIGTQVDTIDRTQKCTQEVN